MWMAVAFTPVTWTILTEGSLTNVEAHLLQERVDDVAPVPPVGDAGISNAPVPWALYCWAW